MWCFAVSVDAVYNDSTVSVVCFDISGTLKQKVGVALPASAALPPKSRFNEWRKFRTLSSYSVGRLSGRKEATSTQIISGGSSDQCIQ